MAREAPLRLVLPPRAARLGSACCTPSPLLTAPTSGNKTRNRIYAQACRHDLGRSVPLRCHPLSPVGDGRLLRRPRLRQ